MSVFWFAVMIINATYTANLAAHLTVSRMQTPIETIFDLARQVKIGYGTLKDSQLQTFFQNTDVPRWAYLDIHFLNSFCIIGETKYVKK